MIRRIISFLLFILILNNVTWSTHSAVPTQRPSRFPTTKPTMKPTTKPTSYPSYKPSIKPSSRPTRRPTSPPTSTPTSIPTSTPTSIPTSHPTSIPTSSPTGTPTVMPTYDIYFRQDRHALTPFEYAGIAVIIFLSSLLTGAIIYFYRKYRQKISGSRSFTPLDVDDERAGLEMQDRKTEYTIPLILVGDSGSGKTCLMKQFLDSNFDQNSLPTISILAPRERTFDISPSLSVRLTLLDTPGRSRFQSQTFEAMREASGYLIVFDLTDPTSFSDAYNWLKAVDSYSAESSPAKILVGTKSDLKSNRVIRSDQARKLALENRAAYIETSSLRGKGVNEAFLAVTKRLLMKKLPPDLLFFISPAVSQSSLARLENPKSTPPPPPPSPPTLSLSHIFPSIPQSNSDPFLHTSTSSPSLSFHSTLPSPHAMSSSRTSFTNPSRSPSLSSYKTLSSADSPFHSSSPSSSSQQSSLPNRDSESDFPTLDSTHSVHVHGDLLNEEEEEEEKKHF